MPDTFNRSRRGRYHAVDLKSPLVEPSCLHRVLHLGYVSENVSLGYYTQDNWRSVFVLFRVLETIWTLGAYVVQIG